MSSFDLILRDIQLPVNSFISHYISDFRRYYVPELWLQREGSMLEDCIYIYVQSNTFINDIFHWKAPNTSVSSVLHTWKLSGPFYKSGHAQVQPCPAAWASTFLCSKQLDSKSRADAKSQGAKLCSECRTTRVHWSSKQREWLVPRCACE